MMNVTACRDGPTLRFSTYPIAFIRGEDSSVFRQFVSSHVDVPLYLGPWNR